MYKKKKMNIFILNIFLHHLLLVYPLLCFLLLLLSIYLLAPEEDNFLSKALVYYCFLVFRRIGEYISLDLFYVAAIVIVITGSPEEEEDEKVSK